MIYCIVASVTKECVNTIMNINILVAEKGGAQAPWAPLLDPPLVAAMTGLPQVVNSRETNSVTYINTTPTKL